MSGFVHLHTHTTWSLRDGAIPAEALPHLARQLGYDSVAMTDHDALTGAVRFARGCRAAGVKPIYGAELTVEPAATDPRRKTERGSVSDRREPERSGGGGRRGSVRRPATHVTVIARDRKGYGNLCRLISASHLGNERGEPSLTMAAIAERAEGLFVLSGCERGEVARLAAAGLLPDAVAAARRWRDAIGDGYRIEVFDHRTYGSRMLRDRLLRIAHETEIPPVATNDVHYATPGDAGVHELLNA
ncbi:MAG: PHP domain-containing protein, partial [Actinomycetota bacterium]|nr:PHP domain-containing protein [Actinomycetota bacterium]